MCVCVCVSLIVNGTLNPRWEEEGTDSLMSIWTAERAGISRLSLQKKKIIIIKMKLKLFFKILKKFFFNKQLWCVVTDAGTSSFVRVWLCSLSVYTYTYMWVLLKKHIYHNPRWYLSGWGSGSAESRWMPIPPSALLVLLVLVRWKRFEYRSWWTITQLNSLLYIVCIVSEFFFYINNITSKQLFLLIINYFLKKKSESIFVPIFCFTCL